jgi:hypothetical protein
MNRDVLVICRQAPACNPESAIPSALHIHDPLCVHAGDFPVTGVGVPMVIPLVLENAGM